MLRILLLGLLIPFGVGVLAAMELRTPPRNAAAAVEPLVIRAETRAETHEGISGSQDALAKADRLDVVATKPEPPAQPAIVSERTPRSETPAVSASEPPRMIKRHRPDPKPKKLTAAIPKAKPRTAEIKRTAIPARAKSADSTEPCRLSAFGGLRKALNWGGCEI